MISKSPTATPFGALGESFDLMQKMWGIGNLPTPANLASMAARMPPQLPSMLAPTVDLGELDKRIADLRAVGQWLELNANMLRTTIQTLEVQRATIATLKGITGAMLAPMMGAPASPPTRAPLVIPPELQTGLAAAQAEPVEPTPARPARAKRSTAAAAPSLADDALNPAAWWQALQEQFTKIAGSTGDQPAADEVRPKAAAKRRRRKR